MIKSGKLYPAEFHQWIAKGGYRVIDGKWWTWPDEEKGYIWICDTTEQLYEIFLRETEYKEKED